MSNTYLRIRGTFSDDMVFVPRTGFETSYPQRSLEGDSNYALVALDALGSVLLSVVPTVSAQCCGPTGHPNVWRLSACLPLNPRTVAYELRKGGLAFHKEAIAPEPPKPPAFEVEETKSGIVVRWTATSAAREQSFSLVMEIDKGPRSTLARDIQGGKFELNWEEVPLLGTGRIYLRCHEGVRNSKTEVFKFNRPLPPPSAQIISLGDRHKHENGQLLSLVGACSDPFGREAIPEMVEWRIDGRPVAKGALIEVAECPGEGRHKIELVVRINGIEVSASQDVEVSAPSADFIAWQQAELAHRARS
jgi:hypothetical protein